VGCGREAEAKAGAELLLELGLRRLPHSQESKESVEDPWATIIIAISRGATQKTVDIDEGHHALGEACDERSLRNKTWRETAAQRHPVLALQTKRSRAFHRKYPERWRELRRPGGHATDERIGQDAQVFVFAAAERMMGGRGAEGTGGHRGFRGQRPSPPES